MVIVVGRDRRAIATLLLVGRVWPCSFMKCCRTGACGLALYRNGTSLGTGSASATPGGNNVFTFAEKYPFGVGRKVSA
jgi:hypothetical protein